MIKCNSDLWVSSLEISLWYHEKQNNNSKNTDSISAHQFYWVLFETESRMYAKFTNIMGAIIYNLFHKNTFDQDSGMSVNLCTADTSLQTSLIIHDKNTYIKNSAHASPRLASLLFFVCLVFENLTWTIKNGETKSSMFLPLLAPSLFW